MALENLRIEVRHPLMATDWLLGLLAISLGFAMGFSAAEGSICAVQAGRQLVFTRDPRLLVGSVLASGVAGVVCLPLAWTMGMHAGGMRAGLPPDAAISAALISGAIFLAIGALVNGACLLGTLSRIAAGEVRYLALPLGLAGGFALLAIGGIDRPRLIPNLFARPALPGFLVVSVSAFAILAGWVILQRLGDSISDSRWRLRLSMVVIGLAGALLFVVTPGWTYADAVQRETAAFTSGIITMQAVLAPALTAVATVFGAIVSGLKSGCFRLQSPRTEGLARSFGGGVLMAAGTTLIPGGNDALLLWSIPGGSVSGLVAYFVMTGCIVMAFFGLRMLRARTPRP